MGSSWQTIINQAEGIRHELHTNPELTWHENQTAERIRSILTRLNIPWRVCAKTGTVAQINPGAARSDEIKHIALRGDIDALPIEELTAVPYRSVKAGRMHACGHDGHTATLLATAEWLKLHEDKLPGAVTLLFQPAEEGGYGAKKMVEDGALDGVDEIYGWHNWPTMPFGTLACPDGIVMSGNALFSISVKGIGGHASQPEKFRDPVLAGSAIVVALQQVVSRRLPPQESAVVTVTSFDAVSAPNVVREAVTLSGGVRFSSAALYQTIESVMHETVTQTGRAYGVDARLEIAPGYPATVNHASQAEFLRTCWLKDQGAESYSTEVVLPLMASEDFSYYLQQVPGAFALVGSNDGPEHGHPCHSPYYDFNDRLIPLVTKLFSRIVGAPSPD